MQSILSRANALFAFCITVVGVLGVCLYATSFLYETNGDVQINVDLNNVRVKNSLEVQNDRKRNDIVFFSFDLNVDLEHLFNWNVKQLFLYLHAEYKTKQNDKINQVVLWDRIFLKEELAKNKRINLRNVKTEYNLWDDGDGLRGNQNVTLTLSWNIIPNIGTLPLIMGNGKQVVVVPSQYSTNNQ